MSTARMIEYRITRDLLRRRSRGAPAAARRLAVRVISAAALGAALLLIGSYLQELLWALMAGGVVLTLGTRTH